MPEQRRQFHCILIENVLPSTLHVLSVQQSEIPKKRVTSGKEMRAEGGRPRVLNCPGQQSPGRDIRTHIELCHAAGTQHSRLPAVAQGTCVMLGGLRFPSPPPQGQPLRFPCSRAPCHPRTEMGDDVSNARRLAEFEFWYSVRH